LSAYSAPVHSAQNTMNNKNKNLSLVAADDHRLFLQGLTGLLSTLNGVRLAAVCGDGDALLRLVLHHRPDLVLLDISMPGPPAEETLQRIAAGSPRTRVVVLTMHLDNGLSRRLFELGLWAYVSKSDAFEELSGAIEAVRKGLRYVSPALQAQARIEAGQDARLGKTAAVSLSGRELAVLEWAARGETHQSIADALCITERTVRFHLGKCCEKLGAKSKAHAIALATQRRLIRVD